MLKRQKSISTDIFLKKYLVMILLYIIIRAKEKNLISAVDLRKVLENFGAEILNNFNLVKNMLKERLPPNFIPMKYKELLAEKSRERLLVNKIVPIKVFCF
jgi:hypothetical protein